MKTLPHWFELGSGFAVVGGILGVSVIVLMLPAVILQLILVYPETTNKFFGNELSVLVCIGAAILLYFLRSRKPIWYGALEVFAGYFTMMLAIAFTVEVLATRITLLSAGVYVMIRGFDNIEKGLPRRYRVKWRSVFFWEKVCGAENSI